MQLMLAFGWLVLTVLTPFENVAVIKLAIKKTRAMIIIKKSTIRDLLLVVLMYLLCQKWLVFFSVTHDF